MAAKRWRSKFGRPAKVLPILGDVDPSGQFCAVPEDWLQKKFGTNFKIINKNIIKINKTTIRHGAILFPLI